jgi:hypothetical protein
MKIGGLENTERRAKPAVAVKIIKVEIEGDCMPVFFSLRCRHGRPPGENQEIPARVAKTLNHRR